MHPIKELKSTCTRTSHTFNLNFKSNANLLPSRDADNPQVGFSPLTRENSPSLRSSSAKGDERNKWRRSRWERTGDVASVIGADANELV